MSESSPTFRLVEATPQQASPPIEETPSEKPNNAHGIPNHIWWKVQSAIAHHKESDDRVCRQIALQGGARRIRGIDTPPEGVAPVATPTPRTTLHHMK